MIVWELSRKLVTLYSESDDQWVCSGWQPATNVILQDPTGLHDILHEFNIFINFHFINEKILTKLAADIELRDEVDISGGRDILQREPGRLEE